MSSASRDAGEREGDREGERDDERDEERDAEGDDAFDDAHDEELDEEREDSGDREVEGAGLFPSFPDCANVPTDEATLQLRSQSSSVAGA